MTDPIFISSPVNVLTGDAARVALEQTNDAVYLTPGKGVLSVPLERWQKAQAYERETWFVQGIHSTEDRNTEHAAMFDGYAALPKKLGSVIELGCGAFTNLRFILSGRKADRIVLLDPMVQEYKEKHPNCTYRDGAPDVGFDQCPTLLCWTPIEEFYDDGVYNTVVMVNTLPHCQDANKVFDWINTHLRKGGYLVFGEPVRDIDPAHVYDVGHPISFNQGVIDDFLSGYKEKYRNGNYFIGVKK